MKITFPPDTPPVTWRERLITLALIALMLAGVLGIIATCGLLLTSGGL